MADTLTIDMLGSLQVKTNGVLTDIVEIADRDITGTVKFESITTVASGASLQQLVLPTGLAGVGKYVCIKSDLPITVTMNGTTNSVICSLMLVKLESPNLATFYMTNANATTATVRVFVVG